MRVDVAPRAEGARRPSGAGEGEAARLSREAKSREHERGRCGGACSPAKKKRRVPATLPGPWPSASELMDRWTRKRLSLRAARSMKILITGIAGFIGSHLAERLLARGDQIVGLDNFDPFYGEEIKQRNLASFVDQIDFHRGDILDSALLDRILTADSFDAVVHLAALAGVRPSIQEPWRYQQVNVVGTSRIAEAMVRHGPKRLVFASSSSVYGDNSEVPYSEEQRVDLPASPYAASKRSCELLLRSFNKIHGLAVCNLRFFTVYGPRQRPEMAIHKFCRLAEQDKPITLFGDGQTSRDYTYIDDIIDGTVGAIDKAPDDFSIYNLGGTQPAKLSELVDHIGEALGKQPQVDRGPLQPGDVMHTWASVQAAARDFGYAPKVGIRDGLTRFVTWLREQPPSLDSRRPRPMHVRVVEQSPSTSLTFPSATGSSAAGPFVDEGALPPLVALLCDKLGGVDSYVQIYGAAPEADNLLWTALPDSSRRVVVRFAAALDEPLRHDKQQQLQALVAAFATTLGDSASSAASAPSVRPPPVAAGLDEALASLAERCEALSAIVIDRSSPVLWGKSHALLGLGEPSAGALQRLLGVDDDTQIDRPILLVLTARAARRVRDELAGCSSVKAMGRLVHQQDDFGVFARRLADAYALVLSFGGRFSELKVNGIVRGASGRLEHLLAKIPPIEPPPDPARRGRVIALRKP